MTKTQAIILCLSLVALAITLWVDWRNKRKRQRNARQKEERADRVSTMKAVSDTYRREPRPAYTPPTSVGKKVAPRREESRPLPKHSPDDPMHILGGMSDLPSRRDDTTMPPIEETPSFGGFGGGDTSGGGASGSWGSNDSTPSSNNDSAAGSIGDMGASIANND